MAFAALRSNAHGTTFWLDGGIDAAEGQSYLGFASDDAPVVTVIGEEVWLRYGGGRDIRYPGSVFSLLRDTTAAVRPDHADGRFRLGWVGYFGYEAGVRIVGSPHHDAAQPDVALMMADRVVAVDHADRSITLHATDDSAGSAWLATFAVTLGELAERATPDVAPPPEQLVATLRHSRNAYLRLIEACQAEIADGNAYQVCLTNEITVSTGAGVRIDPVATYLRLRRANPSHHGGLLQFGDHAIVSSSPEQFLRVLPDGQMTVKPIKGTRRRGGSPTDDRMLAAELVADPKERAENVMIVDLMRNDLGRVAELGSLRVPALLEVETYRTVHQLVSTVTARLPAHASWVDAFESCFPAGSMTGAPKRSAMTIIDRLEGGARGAYAGVFGFIGCDGSVDLAMTIRTAVVGPNGATIGTGGGITSGSVPTAEFDETVLKAAVILEAVGAVLLPEA